MAKRINFQFWSKYGLIERNYELIDVRKQSEEFIKFIDRDGVFSVDQIVEYLNNGKEFNDGALYVKLQ